jgi:PAS domain S-box-containing protein
MNRLLLNTSSDIIIEISRDLKILEFSNEAEKFFGKKREEVLNQNYIQIFVYEAERNKIQNDLDKLFSEVRNDKIKMQVIATGASIQAVECSVKVLLSDLKIARGMIVITKENL